MTWKQILMVVLFISALLILVLLMVLIQGAEVEGVAREPGRVVSGFNDTCLNKVTYLATAASLQRIGEGMNLDRVFRSYGSPLEGYGIIFVRESRRTGIPAELPAAIAGKESWFGRLCFAPHNAWGMLAYPGGWPTWEEGIRASFDWLYGYYGAVQGPHGCPGYCEPDHPWMEDVSNIMGVF